MSQTAKIVKLLEKRGMRGALNTELNKICFRYGARIYELRKDGYNISCTPVRRGLYNYALLDEEKLK